MKKSLLFAASALVLAGCSNDDVLSLKNPDVEGPVAIRVSTGTKGTVTRADKTGQEAAELLGENFVVEGIKGDGSSKTEVIDHYNVNYVAGTAGSTDSNTTDWEYVGQDINALTNVVAQAIKYWDFSQPQYDFIAFSKGKNTEAIDEYFSRADASKLGTTDAVYTVKGSVADLKKCYVADLVTVKKADYNDAIVTPKFRNMGAKVRVAFYETVPGYSVKDLEFYLDGKKIVAENTSAKAALYTAGKELPGGTGVISVTFPTVNNESDLDNNKAHISFKADDAADKESVVTFDELNYVIGKELGEKSDGKYLGRASSEATYAGDITAADAAYQLVLPTGTGHALNLRVSYTLEPIDGSEETIRVTGASAIVPAAYSNWQPNFAYTYIFKISQSTNGTTGHSGDPDDPTDESDPAGLFPITFDAIIMDDVEGGVQETITEVGKPAITTYQNGIVVTENDEYKAGNIYAVVEDGRQLYDAADKGNTVGFVQLFTATIDAGALQALSETTVANCFNNGKKVGDVISVTDANGKKLSLTKVTSGFGVQDNIPAADAPHGVNIDVSNAKIVAASAKTYVFQTLTVPAVYNQVPAGDRYHEGITYYSDELGTVVTPAKASTKLSDFYVVLSPAQDAEYASTPEPAGAKYYWTDGIKYYTRTGTGTTADPYVYTEKTDLVDGASVEGLYRLINPAQPATYIKTTETYYDAAISSTEYDINPFYKKVGNDYVKVELSELVLGDLVANPTYTRASKAQYGYKLIKVE